VILPECEAVLFDLDGTLVDTAPDLLHAVNKLRWRRGLGPVTLNGFRDRVSRGARAMLTIAFEDFDRRTPEGQIALVTELLATYGDHIHRDSVLFPGMASVLAQLSDAGVLLGIVTNKPVLLAERLLDAMGLRTRFPVVIGGDSLPERKPHPLPVRTACERLGVLPERALFVGDDARDIEAGKAAGCLTVAVRWGYVQPDELPRWGADRILATPAELPALIGL
jgi:N-acetyl-D-muramate 6-phosphate phosphatase